MASPTRDTPGPSELFATGTRNRPQRTYSHKGRNARPSFLPALKPSRNSPPPVAKRVEFQAFRVGRSNSWELIPLDLPGQLEVAQETSGPAAACDEDIITSPVTPPKSSRGPSLSERSDGIEADDEEEDDYDSEDDDILILSRHPPISSLKHDRRTGNGTRSLRRRPFLIFDRTEAKGYKQLHHRPQTDDSPPPSSYRPGDGFSGREAKPNGSNFLTRNGKQSVSAGPHVGILDLTQSEPPPAKKKRRVRRVTMEDNSFMPPQKRTKQERRPLGSKDPNQQLKPTGTASNQEKKDNVAHVKTSNTTAVPAVQQAAAVPIGGANTQPQAQNSANNPAQPPQSATNTYPPSHPITQQCVSNPETASQTPDPHGVNAVDVTAIIERSDGPPHEPSGVSEGVEEGHDSYETHVSLTPPRQLRIRALSVSPRSPSRRAGGKREFRRVNTQ